MNRKSHPIARHGVALTEDTNRGNRDERSVTWQLFAILLIVLGAAAGGLLFMLLHNGRTTERLGRLSRAEAGALGNTLCARLTGGPCQLIDASPRTTPATRTSPPRRAWDLTCRAASSADCSLQIDADTKELRLFQKEASSSSVKPATAAGDGTPLTPTATAWYTRHYLSLAGLPLPTGGIRRLPSLGTAVTFECEGASRLVQVRIDPRDASLAFLLNRPIHRVAPQESHHDAPILRGR